MDKKLTVGKQINIYLHFFVMLIGDIRKQAVKLNKVPESIGKKKLTSYREGKIEQFYTLIFCIWMFVNKDKTAALLLTRHPLIGTKVHICAIRDPYLGHLKASSHPNKYVKCHIC